MAIDWFTVIAQIINFLILVWLLKKLLFRPIMNAMERRELGISGKLQQAHRQKADALALQKQYQEHLQQLQADKDAVMAQAKAEAESEITLLLQNLNDEMQRKKARFEAEIQQQQQELSTQILELLSEKTLKLSDKVLRQLADQDLEQRLIDKFLRHLSELPEQQQADIKQVLQQHRSELVTRFQPDPTSEQKLKGWFEAFAPGCDMTFVQRDSLICGISVEAGGQSWEWNIERYLADIDAALISASGQES